MGLIAIVGALLGGVEIVNTTLYATSAPQQAAGMAVACAYAIVPYVFARGVEMLQARPLRRGIAPAPFSPNQVPGTEASSGETHSGSLTR